MKNIAVIGSGPVGLATADTISRDSSINVFLVSTTERVPETFHAAAAFWTPFSSGVDPAMELKLSRLTLDFYNDLRNVDSGKHGIIWRRLEQYWLKNRCIVPDWKEFELLDFNLADESMPFTSNGQREWRLEFSYNAPVIEVAQFRSWYKERILSRDNVESFEMSPIISRFEGVAGKQLERLIQQKSIDGVVLCLGAATVYLDLYDVEHLNPDAIAFRKGVVGFVPAKPMVNEPVILFEGGLFDVDALYVVPHENGYIVGGTISPAEEEYRSEDWQVSEGEISGIKARADFFLDADCKNRLSGAGFWNETAGVDWRVGVRPVLKDKGPYVAEAQSLSQKFTRSSGTDVKFYTHFGHGGSGFTFCHDTAQMCVEKLRNDGVIG